MKVLVTGGSGFLGSHLVDALLDAGHHVTVLDRTDGRPGWRPLASGSGADAGAAPASRLVMRIGALEDPQALAAAVAGQDAVYHLAGFADLNAAKTAPMQTAHANILGTLNLIEAMRGHGVSRLLFASTVYVYSREGGFYRVSKQACEGYIEEYERRFGLRYTILRYGSLYGPRADGANGVYRLLRQAIEGKPLAYTGGPDDIREYIHVEDAARLSVDALDASYEGKHVLLTGPSATRAGDLFTMFQEILGRPVAVEYRQADGPGSGHYAVTPYAYTPKPGRKLVTTHYVDMGQGLLRMVEDISRELDTP